MSLPRFLGAKPANDAPAPFEHDPLGPPPPSLPPDIEAEIDAQRVCYAALAPLSDDARQRTLGWLAKVLQQGETR